ncbi:MAG: CoA transferase, partial [Chloroflexi bacterium]|nr:CoA transferase [Chloroflexota bacterium]
MTFPLEDVRVLDLTRLLTGPVATMLLADHGAEVIKIEMPPHGDTHRTVGVPDEFIGGEGLHFLAGNRNKKSILLDLKDTHDLEVFYALVKKSDVVFDNYRPGVLENLGIDHVTLKRHNPRIISCSISGFGSNSSEAQRPAFDPIIQAMSGFMSVTRDATGRPIRTGVAVGDLVPSICAAYAVSLALLGRAKTGHGYRIDISMLDCLVGLLAYYATRYLSKGYIPTLSGGHMSVAPWGTFKTKDGYIVLAVPNDSMWRDFCSAVGRPELGQDERFGVNNKRKANERDLNAAIDSV